MEQMKKLTSYNSRSIYYLSNFVMILLFCGILPPIYTAFSQVNFIYASFFMMLVISVDFIIIIFKKRCLLRTELSIDKIVSKMYLFKVCSFSWLNVKYAATFFDQADRWTWSRYIILSDEIIDEKHCSLATYKCSNQIIVRVTEKNAAELLPIINQKLGLSIELGTPDKNERRMFEIKG